MPRHVIRKKKKKLPHLRYCFTSPKPLFKPEEFTEERTEGVAQGLRKLPALAIDERKHE